ncbi:ATP-binding protein [Kitasatospora sp. NPDC001660]
MATALETEATIFARSRCIRQMPCAPESAKAARVLVEEKFTKWGRLELIDTAQLIISELVGNSARHTGCTRITVSLRLEGPTISVAVRDSSHTLPIVITTSDKATSGRGMALVDALSPRWGVEWAPRGKWVWAEVPTPPKTPLHRV